MSMLFSWWPSHLFSPASLCLRQIAFSAVFYTVLTLLCAGVLFLFEQLTFIAWRRGNTNCLRVKHVTRFWKSNLQLYPGELFATARRRKQPVSIRAGSPARVNDKKWETWVDKLCKEIYRHVMENFSAPLHRIGFGLLGAPWLNEAGCVLLTLPTCALALHDALAQHQQLGSSMVQRCAPWVVLAIWPVYVVANHKVIHVVRQQTEGKAVKEAEPISAAEEETEGLIMQQLKQQEQEQDHHQLRQTQQGHRGAQHLVTPSAPGTLQGRVIGASGAAASDHQVTTNARQAEIRGDFETWRNNQLWCHKCQVWRPPYTFHCNTCGVCIEGRDHHCGLFGVCVGDDNRAPFILICILVIIGLSADVVMLWPRLLAPC